MAHAQREAPLGGRATSSHRGRLPCVKTPAMKSYICWPPSLSTLRTEHARQISTEKILVWQSALSVLIFYRFITNGQQYNVYFKKCYNMVETDTNMGWRSLYGKKLQAVSLAVLVTPAVSSPSGVQRDHTTLQSFRSMHQPQTMKMRRPSRSVSSQIVSQQRLLRIYLQFEVIGMPEQALTHINTGQGQQEFFKIMLMHQLIMCVFVCVCVCARACMCMHMLL